MLRESESEKVERPRCRVVGRASNNANANGGLVYSNANNVSTNSNTNNGSRLTLRRKKCPFGQIYRKLCTATGWLQHLPKDVSLGNPLQLLEESRNITEAPEGL